MIVQRYTADQQPQWDDFVSNSKNGTFLFFRGYMDYHRDRFPDHSLLVRGGPDRLLAVLPAHREGDTLISHDGLTYGGFVYDDAMKLGLMLEVFDATLTYLQEVGVHHLVYKTIPHIYHRAPAEEDRYALFAAGAQWIRCGALAVVQRGRRIAYQERRSRGIKRARGHGLTVARSTDFEGYWAILTERLEKSYHARPVHTAVEMGRLSRRFPEHVKLFACHRQATMVAGIVIYETANVARTQYIASTDAGRSMGAVDLLLDHLLTDVYEGKPYFDLGTSEADGPAVVNQGLVEQKEGFGARAVGLDQYTVPLADWKPGQLLKVFA